MKDYYCHNYLTCRLINNDHFSLSTDLINSIKEDYCENQLETWKQCRRYLVKSELGFCPDFVLPDTIMPLAEIIERFDNESETKK